MKKIIAVGGHSYIANKSAEIDTGIIHVPWISILNQTGERNEEYNRIMSSYNEAHKCCPKCGSEDHTSTLMGFVLNMSKPEEYKDRNKCECMECGDVHIAHDRVQSGN